MKTKIEIEIDIPDGYEFVRYGKALYDEMYLCGGDVYRWTVCAQSSDECCILKKKPWRAEKGGEYWTLGIYSVWAMYEGNRTSDDRRYALGFYKRTQEEAETLLKKIKAVAEESRG